MTPEVRLALGLLKLDWEAQYGNEFSAAVVSEVARLRTENVALRDSLEKAETHNVDAQRIRDGVGWWGTETEGYGARATEDWRVFNSRLEDRAALHDAQSEAKP